MNLEASLRAFKPTPTSPLQAESDLEAEASVHSSVGVSIWQRRMERLECSSNTKGQTPDHCNEMSEHSNQCWPSERTDLTSLGLNRTRGILPSISLAIRFTPSSPAAADLLLGTGAVIALAHRPAQGRQETAIMAAPGTGQNRALSRWRLDSDGTLT